MEHVTYVEGRGNLLLEYSPPGAKGTVAFVGSHLDVVPANPETWERNPFKLTIEVWLVNPLRLFDSLISLKVNHSLKVIKDWPLTSY